MMNDNTLRENSLSPDKSDAEPELWTVVVIDASGTRLAERLESDTALTLLGLMSEDPNCWEECSTTGRAIVRRQFANSQVACRWRK